MRSFDQQFADLHRAAYRVAYTVLGDHAEAQDIAQESLARALVRWRKVEPYAIAWVSRVAANLAIDRTRRDRRSLVDAVEQGRQLRRRQAAALRRRACGVGHGLWLSDPRSDDASGHPGLRFVRRTDHRHRVLSPSRRSLADEGYLRGHVQGKQAGTCGIEIFARDPSSPAARKCRSSPRTTGPLHGRALPLGKRQPATLLGRQGEGYAPSEALPRGGALPAAHRR